MDPSPTPTPRPWLLLGLLAGALALLYAVSEAVAPVYPEARARHALLEAHQGRIEAVTLGHSHNRAVLFDSLAPGGGFHLWRSSRDVVETRWAFEAERPRLPRLRTVLVAVAPYAWDNAAIQPQALDRRRELYALHPTAGRWRRDLGLRVHALAAPVVRGDHWKGVLYALAGRPLVATVGPYGWVDDRPRDLARDAATLDSIAVLTADAHRGVDRLAAEARPGFCGEAAEALAALPAIAGQDAAGEPVRVVFYTPPYWPAYLDRIEAAPTCDLRPVARRLADASPAVAYFDDSRHAVFAPDASLFLDADHLNVVGAAQYSALLRARLAGAAPR